MAACGSLQHIFEKPLPENPTLLESLSSWNQIKSPKPIEDSSFTEIFGELHFKDIPESSSSSSSFSSTSSSTSSLPLIYQTPDFIEHDNGKSLSSNSNEGSTNSKSPSSDHFSGRERKPYAVSHKTSDSFSSMNSESLQLCTEGLGFESSDDIEDLISEMSISNDWQSQEERINVAKHAPGEMRRSRSIGRTFPPPISSIGKSGKPWVYYRSFRHDGRFVLEEIKIPIREFFHARREDGRLKLHLCQSDDEILLEEEEEEEDNDEDEEEEEDNDEDEEEEQEEEEEEEEEEEDDDEKNEEKDRDDDHDGENDAATYTREEKNGNAEKNAQRSSKV